MIHAFHDTTRVVGRHVIDGKDYEVCAEAVANYDSADDCLTVNLTAFLRVAAHLGPDVAVPDVEWLPTPEVVREHVGLEEAHEMVSEIFESWCRKVSAISNLEG